MSPQTFRRIWRAPSRLEKVAALLVALSLAVWAVTVERGENLEGAVAVIFLLLQLAAAGAVLAVVMRRLRSVLSLLLWRLRNRLLVAYVFIAVVPVLLLAAMAAVAGYIFYGQVATYMAASELERMEADLAAAARGLAADVAAGQWHRPSAGAGVPAHPSAGELQRMLRLHLPARLAAIQPQARPLDAGEVPAWLKADFHGLAHTAGGYELLAVAPMGATKAAGFGRQYLVVSAGLGAALQEWLPGTIGTARFLGLTRAEADLAAQPARNRIHLGEQEFQVGEVARGPSLAPRAHWADVEVNWVFTVPVTDWESGSPTAPGLLVVSTRPSLLNLRLFSTLGELSRLPLTILAVVGILFLVIEGFSLLIGVRLSRTITRAVADLYEGTARVHRGDFSYRIPVRSRDQLSELAASFNTMTVSLERLIAESREKQRLQSELEIARQVQAQLFPKQVPSLRGLEVAGVCHPARVVSGDYYDFVAFGPDRLALAIGDIAGKGISAALLMASIQSALRAQLHHWREAEAGAQRGSEDEDGYSSTAALVAQLNRQLFESTAAETFATFCYAVYDDAEGRLTYTNAGHLPPLVVGSGGVRRLDCGGIVLGVLPEAQYEEQTVILQPGDLLVAYTDGITELENSYGGQFGEARLLEVLERVRGRPPREVATAIMEAVEAWGDSGEAQDDRTVLVARRV